MRQACRARKVFLEVIAGVIWAEMTVLRKQEWRSRGAPKGEVDAEEGSDMEGEGISTDCFIFLEAKHIPEYLYKVLAQGIPRQPTMNRFKAGLQAHGLPAVFIDLYESFECDYKTLRFVDLYEKLNRTYVSSDTGNYCSFHDVPSVTPPPTYGRPPTPGITNPKHFGGGKAKVPAGKGEDNGAESDDTDILSGDEGEEGAKGVKKESKTFPVPEEIKAETLSQAVASALGRR